MTILNVACAACATQNRVPKDRLVDGPKCGHCKEPVFTFRPVALKGAKFDKFVKNTDIPVVVDVWATWCGPCVQFAPIFEQAAAAWEPRVRFAKVDADSSPEISSQLNIRSIPTLILFHKGKEVTRQSGAMPASMFDQWLEAQLVKLGC